MLGLIFLKVKLRVVLVAALVLAMLVGGLFTVIIVVVAGSPAPASATCNPPINDVPDAPSDSATEQIANAKIIDATAAKLGLSGTASRLAIITALAESSLINIPYGDGAINPDGTVADSQGLFQQQPSQGWGTSEQVMDPEYATTSFLIGKAHDRQGGLVSIPDWETAEPTVTIHAVQGNLDPDHYTRYYADADQIIAKAGIDVSRAGGDGSTPAAPGTNCPVSTGNGTAHLPLDRPFNMGDNYGPRVQPVEGASKWHPAVDIQNWPPCGTPVYASVAGTVTASDRLYLSILNPDNYTVSYLHMHKSERLVNVGDQVTAGQQIGVVGDESPATGCHLDVRIYTVGTTNAEVAALPVSGADSGSPGYVDPEAFYALFGITLCDNTCVRNYTD